MPKSERTAGCPRGGTAHSPPGSSGGEAPLFREGVSVEAIEIGVDETREPVGVVGKLPHRQDDRPGSNLDKFQRQPQGRSTTNGAGRRCGEQFRDDRTDMTADLFRGRRIDYVDPVYGPCELRSALPPRVLSFHPYRVPSSR